MAEGKHSISCMKVKDLLNCTICWELFDEPKSLPCLHTFCEKCLDKFVTSKGSTDKFACPLCNITTEIPKNNVRDFPVNFTLKELITRFVSSESEETKNEEVCVTNITLVNEKLCRLCDREVSLRPDPPENCHLTVKKLPKT